MTGNQSSTSTRLLRNASSQIFGKLLYLLTRLGLPPFILQHITIQEYGIWSTCFLLISYISMGTFGISGVYIRYSAEFFAKGQLDKIGRLLGAGIWLTLGFSILILGGLWLSMTWIYTWFHVDPALHDTMLVLILGVVGAMLLDMLFPYAYVLQGIQRNAEQTLIWTLSYLLETALIVLFLNKGMGLHGLMLAFILRSVFALSVLLIWFKKIVPGFKIHLRGISAGEWRLFLHYGGVLQLVGLISTLFNTAERALAAYVSRGVGAVGILDIGQKFPVMTCQLFNSAANSFLSAITHLHSLDRHDELSRIYLSSTRYLNLLNAMVLGFMAPFAEALIITWMGNSIPYHDAAIVLLYAAIGFHMQALTGPITSYFQAIKKPGLSFQTFILPQALLVIIGFSALMWRQQQSLITLVQLLAAARVISSIGVIIYGNKLLKVSQLTYFKEVIFVGLLPYGVGYILMRTMGASLDWVNMSRWEALTYLIPLGCLYGLSVMITLYSLSANQDERRAIQRWASGLRKP